MENSKATDIEKLSELVVVAEDALSPDLMPGFYDSGQFEYILALPREAFMILKRSGNPAAVIEWDQLAGDAIVKVVEIELYTEAAPDHFRNRQDLDKALSLSDEEALTWLLQLESKTRESVFLLEADIEITWLHEYSIDLTEENIFLIAKSIDQNPAMLAELDKERVGQPVKGSQNIEQAIAFVSERIEEPQDWRPTALMLSGALDLSSGVLPWQLYSHYHQMQLLVLLAALALLVALALTVGWIHRRRRLPKIREYIGRLLGGQT